MANSRDADAKYHVVCLDYGVKRNILRLFAGLDCKVTVMPATTSAEDVLAQKPDGIFLSNGPGDPAATGEYAVPVIKDADQAPISRSSASASATRCWAWRSAPRPRRCIRAITAPTIRSRTTRRARSRSSR